MSAPSDHAMRLTAVVHGDVQGVGYRYFALRQARALGLFGYARNQRDGTVEVVAEGQRADLDLLLTALRRGPTAANVAEVTASWSQAKQSMFAAFTIRH